MFHNKCDERVLWAQTQKEELTADAVEFEYGDESAEVQDSARTFEFDITGCCMKQPCPTVESVEGGNGLEALRGLMNRHGPRMALAKRPHFKAITTNTPARRIDEVEANFVKLQLHKKAGRALDEPILPDSS